MADTSTAPGVDRRPLIAYLRIQRDRDREMIAVLSRSVEAINAELARIASKQGIGAAIRREQLAASLAAIHNEIAACWRALGYVVLAGREEAAGAAAETMFPRRLLGAVFPTDDVDYMIRSARASAHVGIETVENRLTLSRRTLSERVYYSQDLVDGKIDDIVNSALARGASARELAADVRGFIRPDTPGGVRYAALRLGRTELNNAFHAGQVKTGIEAPWITGLRWNLSGSHPRPDECNLYAERSHYEGGDAGVWKPEEVPGKPHPNCLCFTTAVTPSRGDFIEQFRAGLYDSYVGDLTSVGGITVR